MQTMRCPEAARQAILIVEDSATQADLLRYILTAAGYPVLVARNGHEALSAIRRQPPALVLSDILMPDMDGYALCRQLKNDPDLHRIPVILLTSLADPVDVIRGLECGADNFIVKPYEECSLLSRIAAMLAHQSLRDSNSIQMGIEVVFAGQRFFITSDRLQILNLLLSTYETAVHKNLELARVQAALRELNDQLDVKVRERTAALEAEIAERQRAEAAVREREAQYRELFENATELIYTCDLAGNLTSLNHMGEQLTGYRRTEALTMNITQLVAPEYVPLIHHMLAHGQTGPTTCEFEICTKDHRRVLLEGSMRCISHQGHAVGIQGIARDMTARRSLELQLRQSQKMEAIGQLTGGLAHDFNNMLGVIVGNLDLLEDAVGDNAVALKRIHTAQRAALRGADLTRRLLAFARRQQLHPEPTLVNDLITEVLALLPRTLGPEIQIVTQLAADVPPARIDPTGLENALLNLAINARDAMPGGGTLTFATKSVQLDAAYPPVKAGDILAGPYVWIAVSDTGQGMPREILDQVFEPFFTTKPRDKGTGLGLAMFYGFVKQSGGNIRLYSEPGHGTTVHLYLPVAEGAARPAHDTAPPRVVVHGQGTVLVVDDEAELLEVAVTYLEEMGFTTLQATDGPSALAVLAGAPALDLVLTDVVMPGGLHGMALAQQIRQQHPDVPVIYASGFPASALAERSQLHVDGPLLTKPYRQEQLAAAVHQALAHRHRPAP